jgi:tRNA A-37 threonylcarbamoyl transferase component Bud32
MAAMVDPLRPDGALALLCENPVSPLRAIDRLRGRSVTGGAAWLGRLVREGERFGFGDAQVFGLLRSALSPTTAFDLSARQTAALVIEAARPYVVGGRQIALSLMSGLARRGLAAMAVPAWLVVLRREDTAPGLLGRRSGRISFFDSWEGKVVWGEPPRHLEKRYRNDREASAEHHALTTLAAAAVDFVPRILDRPAPDRLVLSWTPGRTLEVAALSNRDLSAWIGRAASTLAYLHTATKREDGTVLVHGDYWLGNLLVEGDRIVGVIDWSESYRGRPEDDLHFLVDSLLDLHSKARAIHGRLIEVAREAYAGTSPF